MIPFGMTIRMFVGMSIGIFVRVFVRMPIFIMFIRHSLGYSSESNVH